MLRGRFRQRADGAGRKPELHAADALGLKVDCERPARVALGMADFVTGLGSPAGELADAAHKSRNFLIILKAPEKRLARSSLAWYYGSGKRGCQPVFQKTLLISRAACFQ